MKCRENNDKEKKCLTLELPIQLKVQSWMKNCPSRPPPSLAQQMSEQERGLDTNYILCPILKLFTKFNVHQLVLKRLH